MSIIRSSSLHKFTRQSNTQCGILDEESLAKFIHSCQKTRLCTQDSPSGVGDVDGAVMFIFREKKTNFLFHFILCTQFLKSPFQQEFWLHLSRIKSNLQRKSHHHICVHPISSILKICLRFLDKKVTKYMWISKRRCYTLGFKVWDISGETRTTRDG